MTDDGLTEDEVWTKAQTEHAALVRELADTLDLDAGVADALRRAGIDKEAP